MTPQPPEKGIEFTDPNKTGQLVDDERWSSYNCWPVSASTSANSGAAGQRNIMAPTTLASNAVRRAARLVAYAAIVALGAAGAMADAQSAAPAETRAASAPEVPPPLRPSPLVTSPSDAQRTLDSNNEPAGGKVMPQLQIPLGKKSGPVVFERRRPPSGAASSSASLIDDSAARCESETDKQVRARCRSRLVQR